MEPPGRRGKYSAVWKNFSLEPGNKARCRICNHVLGYFRSTFNLKRHFQAKHSSLASSLQDNENTIATEDAEMVKKEDTDTEQGEPPVPAKTRIPYNASMIYKHFVKLSPVLKRCVHCNIVITSQSTSNMRRHMVRIHPGVDLGAPVKNSRYIAQARRPKSNMVWNHFTKEPEGKVKCFHCKEIFSFTGSRVSNLKRHLKRRHPYKVFGAELSGAESETDEQQNGSINVRSIDDLRQSAERRSFDDGESRAASMSPKEDPIEMSNDGYIDLPEAINYDTLHDPLNPGNGTRVMVSNRTSANCERTPQRSAYDQFDRNRMFFTANDLQDANFQATVHATNVVLQLQGLDARQRIIAEKLMSEVIYHAKLKNLTEKSMVVVHVGTFEDASKK